MHQYIGSALAQIMACRIFAYSAPSHYLNRCWVILNWTLRDKLEIRIQIHEFSLMKMHLKTSSAKWRPFWQGCPGGDEPTQLDPSGQTWNSNSNTWLFVNENAFGDVVCEMAAILIRVSRGRWANSSPPAESGRNFRDYIFNRFNPTENDGTGSHSASDCYENGR